jgi:sulfoquinovosidase
VRALLFLLVAGCTPSPVEVTLGQLKVRVEASPARLAVYGPDGTALLDGLPGRPVKDGDAPLAAAAFRTTTVDWMQLFGSFNPDESVTSWHGVSEFSAIVRLDDGVSFTFSGGSGEIRQAADGVLTLKLQSPTQNRATASFRCAPSEHFAGFGAQTADLDQRGQEFPLFVSEQGIDKIDTDDPPGNWFEEGTRHQTYFPEPFFVSSRGFGLSADTTNRSVFTLCSERDDAWRVEAWEGTLSLHFFYGPAPADVLRRHSDLVGRPPVPPPFAFAPWNDALFGSDNVRQVATELRANHIPSSVIWTEDWAGGLYAGDNYDLTYDWSVDRTLYPDAEQVANDLHTAGFKWLAYFNTFVTPGDDHYDEGAAQGYVIQQNGAPYLFDSPFFMKTTLVDLSNPAATDWMAQSMNAALDVGFDGWMADYGEWLPIDAQLASGEDALAVHNLYPVAWQKLNERVLSARDGDGVDRLVFVRSGYTGSQGITHQVVWGGDQNTEFKPEDGLPSVVPIGLNLGISGMPYYGSDIGGYQTAPNHPYSTKELYFRWTTVGALSPIMRTHHGVAPALEWHYNSDADTLAHYGRWARLHQKLYPYLRAAAEAAASTGMPMMRALFLGFASDDTSWTIKDEWLLGPSLLVAPVMTEAATSREVYLPPGQWLPLLGGAPVSGGGMITVDVPLTEIPVYVVPGTTLELLGDDVMSLTAGVPDPAERWLYVDHALSGTPTWNGATLVSCGTAPCGDVDPSGRSAVVKLPAGGGTLALGDQTWMLPPAIIAVTVRW